MSDLIIPSSAPTEPSGKAARIRQVEKAICIRLHREGDYEYLAMVPLSPTMGYIGVLYKPQSEGAFLAGALIAMHVQTRPAVTGGTPGLALAIDPVVGSRTAPVSCLHLPPDHCYFWLSALADDDRLTLLESYYEAIKQSPAKG